MLSVLIFTGIVCFQYRFNIFTIFVVYSLNELKSINYRFVVNRCAIHAQFTVLFGIYQLLKLSNTVSADNTG